MSNAQGIADDINIIASFLALDDVDYLKILSPFDCIVICASAILPQAEALFKILTQKPHFTQTVVFCGGIGHSTKYLYKAVQDHPTYAHLYDDIQGMPEAQVLELLWRAWQSREDASEASDEPGEFDRSFEILIEDQSTNCGANATKTRALLESHDIHPKTMLIIQDPTMQLRTVESFKSAYVSDAQPPDFFSWPVFVPKVKISTDNVDSPIIFDETVQPARFLWSMGRFINLLLGEIPRLRDDDKGYGPNGAGFIGHVDIPGQVEDAYHRLESDPVVARIRQADPMAR